jgi:hypothetical protein
VLGAAWARGAKGFRAAPPLRTAQGPGVGPVVAHGPRAAHHMSMRSALAAVVTVLALAGCAGPVAGSTPGSAAGSAPQGSAAAPVPASTVPRPRLQVLSKAPPNLAACHHYATMLTGLMTGKQKRISKAVGTFISWAHGQDGRVYGPLLTPMMALASGYTTISLAERASLEGRIAGYCATIGVNPG